MKSILKKIFNFLPFLLIFIPFSSVHAGTVLEDIQLNLSIETQDLVTDFEDDKEVVERGRTVIYKLEVVNSGPETLHDLRVFMDSPNYMNYQTGSTRLNSLGLEGGLETLEDQADHSPLSLGYVIPNIAPGSTLSFVSEYKIVVPATVLGDPLYPVAIASLVGPYSDLPVMSQPVNSIISGVALGSLNVSVEVFPPAGKTVFAGSTIDYHYHLTNAGGELIEKINLVTFIPKGTECVENCGTFLFSEPLLPGAEVEAIMKVKVKGGVQDLDQITNIGFDVSTETLKSTEVRDSIVHPLNDEIEMGTGVFTLLTEQVPNLILNSATGQPRPDQSDQTETQYVMKYTGRGKQNTYTLGSDYGIQDSGDKKYKGFCSDHTYPHGKNSTVFAYNSTGGICEKMSECSLQSTPLDFLLTTTLPEHRPSLILKDGTHIKSEVYSYGDTTSVNHFMQAGGVIKAPKNFTLSRAVEDGMAGRVNSVAQSQSITEDLWTYTYAGYEKEYDQCSCGEDCERVDLYPVYIWQKTSNTVVDLKDDDTTPISVYSSTAWLKTEGGNLGTNGSVLTQDTEANWVNLTFGGGDYMVKNNYVYDPERILTPSHLYRPTDQNNVDHLLFSGGENEGFSSSADKSWEVEGTKFKFLAQGGAYDRANQPRDFKEDLLIREKFGAVLEDKFPSNLSGTIDIQDNVVWHQTGDLTIGKSGVEDEVIFSGGQARLYVEGDVYINANSSYATKASGVANDITSLRIDARNVYINPEVEDLELLLLARENFYSGESHRQLRILGDVIAKVVHWERKPVLELDPDDINKPSEHVIEDYRKYILPVPGDTELPDENDIWKQVNAGSGY